MDMADRCDDAMINSMMNVIEETSFHRAGNDCRRMATTLGNNQTQPDASWAGKE